MRRASIARQSRAIERALKARVIKDQLEQVKREATPKKEAPSSRFSFTGGDGVTETEKVPPGGRPETGEGTADADVTPVDPAPPIVFDEEGQAYLTDEARESDDDFDDEGPPASPLRNM